MTSVRVLHPAAAGIPIVTIHGVGDSLESWSEVAELLPPERPVVLYTLRGHEADRANPAPPYEMADFVADLISLVDSLGYPRVVLAGFSLGGLIAQATALAHPDRVAAVITVGAVAGRSPEEREQVMSRYREVAERGPLEVARRSVDRWYTPGYLAAHPEARERTLARMGRLDPACYAAAYRVLAANDYAERLGSIEVPVLAIAGEGDVGSPPHMSERIAAAVRYGTAVVIPGVKHQLLQETTETVAKEIDRFVRTHEL